MIAPTVTLSQFDLIRLLDADMFDSQARDQNKNERVPINIAWRITHRGLRLYHSVDGNL